jgi:hypothetical protein
LDHGLGTEKGFDLSSTSFVGSTWLRPQEYDSDDDWMDCERIEECARCSEMEERRVRIADKCAMLKSMMQVWQISSSDSMEENKLRVENFFPTIQEVVVDTCSYQQRLPVQVTVQERVADRCEEAPTCVRGCYGILSKVKKVQDQYSLVK